jgi:hypothetical protein
MLGKARAHERGVAAERMLSEASEHVLSRLRSDTEDGLAFVHDVQQVDSRSSPASALGENRRFLEECRLLFEPIS